MKAEFTSNPRKETLLITPENAQETEELLAWDNCVISSQFTECVTSTGREPCLLICKEV